MPQWLWRVDFPLFVSHRTLGKRVSPFPRATCDWALDSGGFTELSMFNEWRTGPTEYVDAVYRYQEELGSLQFASPQDWMCEPFMIEKTGRSVDEHQQLTVENFLVLRELGPDLPFVPVVQGWELKDYYAHITMYEANGVDLTSYATVGVGSVCRRQATGQIAEIMGSLHEAGLALHGYGVKTRGLALYGEALVSADSMAWSLAGRRSPKLPGCSGHKNCANCLEYAILWRNKVLGEITG